VDFRGYVRALRRGLVLILAVGVIGAAAAVGFSLTQDDMFESKARVIVSSAQAETTDAFAGGLLAEQRAATYVEVVDSLLLANKVIDELDLDVDTDYLLDHLEAELVEDAAVLDLTFTDTDPERAQRILQAFADQLVDTAADIEAPEDGGQAPTKITVIDTASLNESRVWPQPLLLGAAGLVAGLLVGVALALARALLNRTITDQHDLETVTDVPVLGSIGYEGAATRTKLITELEHHSVRVEAFRGLRTNVQFVDVDRERKMFLVTSGMPGEGKTATAVNLALTLARSGIDTLLIDADLRRPNVAGAFAIDGTAGVTTVLLGSVSLDEALWTHEPSGLKVLTSGVVPPNAAELVQTNAMGALLTEVRGRFEVVIIDSPPLIPVTDASLLATRADGTLVVIRHGRTTRDQLLVALERLRQVDVTPVGVVMNAIKTRTQSYGGYGAYTPGGYHAKAAAKSRVPAWLRRT
jgi:capsular exopolysaccharide synthesis family protein